MRNPLHRVTPQSTKEMILAALENLLKDKPLDKVTIREICNDANISIGTFYLYFSCKEECILYIYRSADQIFQNLTFTESATDNIYVILYHLYNMVDFQNISVSRSIYICHLSYYDEYFFSEEREVFQLLKKQILTLKPTCDANHITWDILSFCRGSIYNYCINPIETGEIWHQKIMDKTLDYLTFLLSKE